MQMNLHLKSGAKVKKNELLYESLYFLIYLHYNLVYIFDRVVFFTFYGSAKPK